MRRAIASAVMLAALALLAGCGSSSTTTSTGEATAVATRASEPARKILDEAAAALEHAHSFALHGRLDVERQQTGISLETQEPNVARMTLERGDDVASVIFFGEGKSAYMRANPAFLHAQYAHERVPGAVVALLANRWLKVPAKEAGGQPKELDGRSLGRCLAAEPGTLVVEGLTTVDGQSAVTITDKGDVPGSTPSKLYVAATHEPLLLRAVATGKQRPGGPRHSACSGSGELTEPGDELSFGRYNQPMGITAPAGAVEPSQLAKQYLGG